MVDRVSPEDRELRALLGEVHTIAVVGLSSRAAAARRSKWRPTSPTTGTGSCRSTRMRRRCWASRPTDRSWISRATSSSTSSTSSAAPPETPEVARQAVAIGAKVLWLQEGIVSEEAAAIASAGGIEVIMGVCIKHVRERLIGEPST